MIISTNREPSLQEFEDLCNRMCELMNKKAQKEPEYYLSKGAQKLEPEVKIALDEVANGTKFENTIKIISGQRFPDIVAAKYYGIEVKSTKDDKWTMIGGSVAEGTRVESVEHIFFLFGKLHKPVEFRTRRYEECLCDIAVTHSPRYKIDMNLSEGETIFDKMGISYDEMRKSDNPIEPVVEYFRSTLKPGESLWWVNGEEATSGSTPVKIRMWKTISKVMVLENWRIHLIEYTEGNSNTDYLLLTSILHYKPNTKAITFKKQPPMNLQMLRKHDSCGVVSNFG